MHESTDVDVLMSVSYPLTRSSPSSVVSSTSSWMQCSMKPSNCTELCERTLLPRKAAMLAAVVGDVLSGSNGGGRPPPLPPLLTVLARVVGSIVTPREGK